MSLLIGWQPINGFLIIHSSRRVVEKIADKEAKVKHRISD